MWQGDGEGYSVPVTIDIPEAAKEIYLSPMTTDTSGCSEYEPELVPAPFKVELMPTTKPLTSLVELSKDDALIVFPKSGAP